MILVQQVRVRWDAAGRGSIQANMRRGLPEVLPLPECAPDAGVLVHEVLLDQAADYRPSVRVRYGWEAARSVELGLENTSGRLVVTRLPGGQAYPRIAHEKRLFGLEPGQVGRHRANGRFWFTHCPCDPSWYYEQWTTHVAVVERWQADLFSHRAASVDVDEKVHLYGGKTRQPARLRVAA